MGKMEIEISVTFRTEVLHISKDLIAAIGVESRFSLALNRAQPITGRWGRGLSLGHGHCICKRNRIEGEKQKLCNEDDEAELGCHG